MRRIRRKDNDKEESTAEAGTEGLSPDHEGDDEVKDVDVTDVKDSQEGMVDSTTTTTTTTLACQEDTSERPPEVIKRVSVWLSDYASI